MRLVEQQGFCNLCKGVSCRLAGKPLKEQSRHQETSARLDQLCRRFDVPREAIPELVGGFPMF